MNDAERQELELMITEIVRRELAAQVEVIVQRVFEVADARQREGLPAGLSDFDRELARQVEAVYRNQGRPAKTAAIAVRLGYSTCHTLSLLKDAEQVGAVASIPGRGNRHSGLWVPVGIAA